MDIPKRLRVLMDARKISQYRLCKESGLNQSSLSRYLNGQNSPTAEQLEKLCKALGITLAEFFTEDQPDLNSKDVFTSDDPADYIIGVGSGEKESWSVDLPPEAQKELLEYMKYLAYKYRDNKPGEQGANEKSKTGK